MKFSINQTELQNALMVVLKGVSTRSTLPILSGILLDTQGDRLTLQTTDLEPVSYTHLDVYKRQAISSVTIATFDFSIKRFPPVMMYEGMTLTLL